MTELKYMKDNNEYMKDFMMSLPTVLKIQDLQERSINLAKSEAEENIAKQ